MKILCSLKIATRFQNSRTTARKLVTSSKNLGIKAVNILGNNRRANREEHLQDQTEINITSQNKRVKVRKMILTGGLCFGVSQFWLSPLTLTVKVSSSISLSVLITLYQSHKSYKTKGFRVKFKKWFTVLFFSLQLTSPIVILVPIKLQPLVGSIGSLFRTCQTKKIKQT